MRSATIFKLEIARIAINFTREITVTIANINDFGTDLAYSLGGLAFMAFLSCTFVGYNTTVYPVEFYGGDRLGLTNTQFFLGITALAGHIWHASRARLNS